MVLEITCLKAEQIHEKIVVEYNEIENIMKR